jgi:hypothetical protein
MTLRQRAPDPDAHTDGIVKQTTTLRSGADPFWKRLRELLRARDVEPDDVLLVQLHTEGTDQWLGIVVTPARRVFLFVFDDFGLGEFSEWEELTGQPEHFEIPSLRRPDRLRAEA